MGLSGGCWRGPGATALRGCSRLHPTAPHLRGARGTDGATRAHAAPRRVAAGADGSQHRDNAERTRSSCSPPAPRTPKHPPQAQHAPPPAPSPLPPPTPTDNSIFHLHAKIPPAPAPAAGWAWGRWDRLTFGLSVCPSVHPSVRPAAAPLRALTSALPAAGRWAGGTAPIVLKIIQRSTNSLQISVTARRN